LGTQKADTKEMADAISARLSEISAKLSARVLIDHGTSAISKAVRKEISESLTKAIVAESKAKSIQALWSTFGRVVKVMNEKPEYSKHVISWSGGDFTFPIQEGRKLIQVPKTLEKEIERLVKKYGAGPVFSAVAKNSDCAGMLDNAMVS